MFETLNIWAVVVTTILTVLLGVLWYSSAMFRATWMKALGWDEKTVRAKQKGMGRRIALYTLSALVGVTILALLVSALAITTWWVGLAFGLFMWLGFIVTNNATVTWEGGSRKVWVIYLGYRFVAFAVSGAILAAWH